MTDKPNLTRVWAKTAPGGNVVDPDTVTAGKFTAGWQAEVPPFEYFNFIQKQITEGIAHINEQGIAVWDDLTTYPVGGLAKGSDGNVYKALISQNDNDPVSDGGTNWDKEPTKADLISEVAGKGASLVSMEGGPTVEVAVLDRVIRVTSLSALLSISETAGFQVSVQGYHANLDGGSGVFYWDASKDKALHNGGTVIDPSVVFPLDWDDQAQVTTWFTAGTGAGCWVRLNEDRIDIRAFGAKGDYDGSSGTNDSLALEKCSASIKNILMQDGNFLIDPDGASFRLTSNTDVFAVNASLTSAPTDVESYNIVFLSSVDNVKIKGLTIVGDRTDHVGTSGEAGHGIGMREAKNVTIEDCNISNCWGDGIYVSSQFSGTLVMCDNVLIDNCVITNNRRNNISVVGSLRTTIKDCTITLANGTSPESGIDLEPNPDQTVTNTTIENCILKDNGDFGLLIFEGNGPVNNTVVNNCKITGNGQGANFQGDDIIFSNSYIAENTGRALRVQGTNTVTLENLTLVDNSSVTSDLFGDIYLQQITDKAVLKNVKVRSSVYAAMLAIVYSADVESLSMNDCVIVGSDGTHNEQGVNLVNNCQTFLMHNCLLKNIGRRAILFGAVLTECHVTSSSFIRTMQGSQNESCIYIQAGNIIITGNILDNSAARSPKGFDYGITLFGSSRPGTITSNIIKGYVTDALDLGATDNILANNREDVYV
jgi:parallel beta-helix repeat protein